VPPIDFTRRTAVYRLFDKEGRLLYVGIAFDPEKRWKDHVVFKSWWPDVARKDIEWRDTRMLALAAEAEAIRSEHPMYNSKGNDLPHVIPPVRSKTAMPNRLIRVGDDWTSYAAACEDKGISRSDDLRLYIKAQVAAHKRKQKAEADERAATNIAKSSPDA
jgi:hypothetical protein